MRRMLASIGPVFVLLFGTGCSLEWGLEPPVVAAAPAPRDHARADRLVGLRRDLARELAEIEAKLAAGPAEATLASLHDRRLRLVVALGLVDDLLAEAKLGVARSLPADLRGAVTRQARRRIASARAAADRRRFRTLVFRDDLLRATRPPVVGDEAPDDPAAAEPVTGKDAPMPEAKPAPAPKAAAAETYKRKEKRAKLERRLAEAKEEQDARDHGGAAGGVEKAGVASGSGPPSGWQAAVDARSGALEKCLASAGLPDGVQLVVRATLSPEGRLRDIRVTGDVAIAPSARSCLIDTLAGVKGPAPADRASRVVSFALFVGT